MRKKVVSAEPKDSGSLITYEDGTQEYLDGVNVTLNKKPMTTEPESEDDEETLLAGMRK